MALVAALEVSRIAARWGDRPFTPVVVVLAPALVAGAYALTVLGIESDTWAIGVTVASIVSITWMILGLHKGNPRLAIVATLTSTLYPAGFLFLGPLLRSVEQGREWVMFLLLVTFATDTFAFLVGRVIGRQPLAPSISPSKTIEGAIGGFAGTIVAAAAARYVLSLDAGLIEVLALGGLAGVVGQIGDLVESRLKRIGGVKDSGWIVPGHGGLLDRLDSITFNLVVVYFFVLWIIK
jgi:phosphatidate cytidylyltransferase